jgi:uncharacterized cupin superfamily protein
MAVRTRLDALADLEDDPIRPEDVLTGDPRARSHTWATSADAMTTHWLWDCTAGSFRWWFAFDETVCIVAGAVDVHVDGEAPVHLEIGDAAYFPAGRWSTWTVDSYVRKQAVLRVPVPRALAPAAKVLGQRKYAR